jgi:hypothetical protein
MLEPGHRTKERRQERYRTPARLDAHLIGQRVEHIRRRYA